MKVAELLEGRTADDLANIMPLSYRAGKGHTIEAYGRKGMKNTKWRKFFKNSDAMSKWCEDNDATVEGSRELDKNELREGTVQYGKPEPKHVFSVEIYDPKYDEDRKIKVKANSKAEAEDHCTGKGYEIHKIEQLDEGWKMGAAAVGLSAAVVAGIANSPKVEINGETYDKAMSLRSAPDDAKSATVSINGEKKKVLYWEVRSGKHLLKKKVYAIQEELNEEVIKVEEAGWYVCDYKERPVHGPMSEAKAKALAEQLTDKKKFTAEYFSDYEISRMNEGFVGDAIKGIKRKLKGKDDPKEVEHTYARMARSAIKYKTANQADKAIERFVRVGKVVSPKAYPPGYKAPKQQRQTAEPVREDKKEVHPMDKPGMRKKYLAYVAQMKKLDKPYKSYGSWALYNDTKV